MGLNDYWDSEHQLKIYNLYMKCIEFIFPVNLIIYPNRGSDKRKN